MSEHTFPTQALVREVTHADRTCQISATPSPDGRWEFSLVTCDSDGQIRTDLTGLIAPLDVDLVLSVLPLEVATMGAWSGVPTALDERRRKHPKLYAKWMADEEAYLVDEYRAGAPFTHIAEALGRTVGGVKARLVKLGQMTPKEAGWPMGSMRSTADA